MIFTNSSIKSEFTIYINDAINEKVQVKKFLGVLLNENW